MFKWNFVICFFTLILLKESNADFWCPDNVLETLVDCLFRYDQYDYDDMDDIQKIKHRIGCSSKANCIPKPWDVFNEKITLAREYAECMKKCAVYFNHETLNPLDVFLCDVECRKDFDEKLPKLVIKPLD